MIAQSSTEYRVRPVADGFRVLDKQQHNRGTYPTRQAAEDHILELTTNRAQTHALARDLAQLAATATLTLALLVGAVGSASAAPQPTPRPKPVITCRYERIVVWQCKAGVCRYVRGTVRTCTEGAPAR